MESARFWVRFNLSIGTSLGAGQAIEIVFQRVVGDQPRSSKVSSLAQKNGLNFACSDQLVERGFPNSKDLGGLLNFEKFWLYLSPTVVWICCFGHGRTFTDFHGCASGIWKQIGLKNGS